jgi:hypothetical protein
MTTTTPKQELTLLPLMQLTTGFWASKALFAAHEPVRGVGACGRSSRP